MIRLCANDRFGYGIFITEKTKTNSRPTSLLTVRRRICSQPIGCDVLSQLVTEVKDTKRRISLQLDEPTDVANCCHLLCFVRYICASEISFKLCYAVVLNLFSPSAPFQRFP